MQFILVATLLLCVSTSLAAASLHHHEPPALSVAHQYLEQDSKGGFYSYGYSGDTSARAEYSALDGTAKGFYSYIDADGELQTVRYVAGGRHGFRAEASNLPVDSGKAPLPVRDTPEVQHAKQKHFEAYREAERRAALQPDSQEQQQQQEDDDNVDQQREEEQQQQQQQQEEEVESTPNAADSMAIETSSQQEREEEKRSDDAQLELAALQQSASARLQLAKLDGHAQQLEALSELLSRRGLQLEPSLSSSVAAAEEEVRVPVHAYYTLLSPAANYHVITPTTLINVPRAESLKRGHSLPVALSSTFLSQRVSSSSD